MIFVFHKSCSLKKKDFFFYIFFTFGKFHQKRGLIGQKQNLFIRTGWNFLPSPLFWTSIKVSHRLGKHLSICFWILLFFLQLAEFNLKVPLYSKWRDFFYHLSGSTFIFFKNTHQKAANLMFRLILPVAKGPWLFLEVQCKGLLLSWIFRFLALLEVKKWFRRQNIKKKIYT